MVLLSIGCGYTMYLPPSLTPPKPSNKSTTYSILLILYQYCTNTVPLAIKGPAEGTIRSEIGSKLALNWSYPPLLEASNLLYILSTFPIGNKPPANYLILKGNLRAWRISAWFKRETLSNCYPIGGYEFLLCLYFFLERKNQCLKHETHDYIRLI